MQIIFSTRWKARSELNFTEYFLILNFNRNYFNCEERLRRKSFTVIEKKAILIEDEKSGDASMIDIGAIILTLFLILGNLEAVTVVNHHPDDEYVLEHEVLRKDALAEAKKLEIHPGKDYPY